MEHINTCSSCQLLFVPKISLLPKHLGAGIEDKEADGVFFGSQFAPFLYDGVFSFLPPSVRLDMLLYLKP